MKLLRERIRKTSERAELYLNLAGVIIVALNKDGIITLMNKKGYEVLEYEEGELEWLAKRDWMKMKEQEYDTSL